LLQQTCARTVETIEISPNVQTTTIDVTRTQRVGRDP